MAGNHWALEVPLVQLDAAAAPTLAVAGSGGDAVFQFSPLPEGAAAAGKSDVAVTQGSSSSSRALVWQLEGATPSQLLLQEVGVNEERRGGGVRLSFAAPLLPAVSCIDLPQQHGTRLAMVTADGVVHTIQHRPPAGAAAAAGGGLARQLSAPGAVTSVPLAAAFQRTGAPTTLLEVDGTLCIGTAEGDLLCMPAGGADPAAAFQLTPTSGLTRMLGGFFGRPGGQAVRQLAELCFMDQHLVCAIHESGQLRLWDLRTRRWVHARLWCWGHHAWLPLLPLHAATRTPMQMFAMLAILLRSATCTDYLSVSLPPCLRSLQAGAHSRAAARQPGRRLGADAGTPGRCALRSVAATRMAGCAACVCVGGVRVSAHPAAAGSSTGGAPVFHTALHRSPLHLSPHLTPPLIPSHALLNHSCFPHPFPPSICCSRAPDCRHLHPACLF